MEFTNLQVPVIDLTSSYISSYSDKLVSFVIFGLTFNPSYDICSNTRYDVVITELEALSRLLLHELLELEEPTGTIYFVAHGRESILLDMIQNKHVMGTRGAYFTDTENSEYDMPLYVIFAFDNPMGTLLVNDIRKNLQKVVRKVNIQATELYRLLPVLK
ncbi:MAG: hypothetical protein WC942_11770 [Clostridia bacterium]|jgi:hypothetical protein